MHVEEVLARLEAWRDPHAAAGMARYGIKSDVVYGVSIPRLRSLAREIERDHALALELWEIAGRETRILASMTAEPSKVDDRLMEDWVLDFDCWEVCDQVCMNIFEKTPLAFSKAEEWSQRGEEFVKRAGFVLMARLAVSDKAAGDAAFERFFPLIRRGAEDERNMVKKAVNWALRQIGKRNEALNRRAIGEAEALRELDSRSARWVASDALRELGSEAVQARLHKKGSQR